MNDTPITGALGVGLSAKNLRVHYYPVAHWAVPSIDAYAGPLIRNQGACE